MKPNCPSLPPWNSSQRRSTCAVIRPTGSPSRQARKYSASACSKYGFFSLFRNCSPLEDQRRDPGSALVEPQRQLDELVELAPALHGSNLDRAWHGRGKLQVPDFQACPTHPSHDARCDVFEKARTHDRVEQLEAAKQGDLLPYFRILESQAGPVVEMEGRETIMLGSNNYLGLTTRRARQAGGARRPRAVRHRRHRIAPAERHHPDARRARARARRLDGHRGRDRLHDRLPVEPRRDQRDPRARATRLSATRATTPRSSTAASSPAPACAPSATTGWTSWRRCWSGPSRDGERHAGGGRRRLLDGGRRLRPAADRRALQPLRGEADGR